MGIARGISGRLPSPGRAVLLLLAVAPAGCAGYVLRGQVIEGAGSDMTMVTPDDPRLERAGVTSVRVSVVRDPDKLAARMVGTGLSDAGGRFAIALDAFGAGYLAEEFRIRASKPGYQTAETRQRLAAGKDRYLLVILAPGYSPPEPEDYMEQFERFR